MLLSDGDQEEPRTCHCCVNAMPRNSSGLGVVDLLQSQTFPPPVKAWATAHTAEKPQAARDKVSQDDRRAHARIAAEDLWWLRTTRLRYGAPVSVLDLSAGGALLETDFQMQPGSSLVLELLGLEGPTVAPFRVVRCQIASLNGGLRYRGACAFKRPLDLPDLLGSSSVPGREQQTHLRLDLALKSIVAAYIRQGATRGSDKSAVNEGLELIDYLKRLWTRAVRRPNHAFDQLVRGLLEDSVAVLQRRGRWEAAQAQLEERLRRALPQLKIQIVPAPRPTLDGRVESVHFALEPRETAPAQFLYVEIPDNHCLDEAQFRLLKAATDLMTLLRSWDCREMSALKGAAG